MSELIKLGGFTRAFVDAKAFSGALKKTALVLKRSSIPVLEEVCVRFSSGRCILAATDMSTWIITEIPAGGDDFSFVFSRTKDIEKVCRNFSGNISLEMREAADGTHSRFVVTLSNGSRIGEFDVYPAEDYLDIPELDGEVSFRTNAASLLERISKVAYATLKPEQSGKENSACVEFSGRQVYALDGYRAAWDVGDSTFPQPFLVYAEPLHYLKVFGGSQVDFRFSKPKLFVTDGSTTIIFHTAESAPFNLGSAIPQKYLEEFSVSPKDFLCELKYLRDVTPVTRKPYVYLRGNELYMPVNGRRYSTALAISRTGDTTVGFNLRYLSDALEQFKREKRVTVKISGIHSPLVIEAEGRSDRAMVLPVRVGAEAAA